MSNVENPPAFPQSIAPDGPFGGMTLRDWFAGQALGAMKLSTGGVRPDGVLCGEAVRSAYAYADAMLTARGPQ